MVSDLYFFVPGHHDYVVCALKQTDPPGHLRPGGFDQPSGPAAAAAVECTYKDNKTKRETSSLTLFILLFNEANKMPGCHMFVVEIIKSAKPHCSSL